MNTTALLKTSVERGGPIAMTASVAALTAAIVGVSHERVGAQPQPAPTVTVTATQAPVVSRTTATPPSGSPGSGSTGQTRVVAVAAPGSSSADRPGTVAPSGPSPAPRPPASGTSSGGVRAAVRLSHPLGVLPNAAVDLTVGDTR